MIKHPRQFRVYWDEVHEDFRWELYANDRRLAVSGQGYDVHGDCLESIRLVMEFAPGTQIHDEAMGRWRRKP